jgi:hypothetical protein
LAAITVLLPLGTLTGVHADQPTAPAPAGSVEKAAPAVEKAAPAVEKAAPAVENAAPVAKPPSFAGLFGPNYDTTRPPPQPPEPRGPGIVSAALVASGDVIIEGLGDEQNGGKSPYFGVLLDVRIAADSTTKELGKSSIVATTDSGKSFPLEVACLPTADAPLSFFTEQAAPLGVWNVSIGGQFVTCGGRTARLAYGVDAGGFWLSNSPGTAWNGPMLLLFETKDRDIRHIALPGPTVQVPPAKNDGEEKQ